MLDQLGDCLHSHRALVMPTEKSFKLDHQDHPPQIGVASWICPRRSSTGKPGGYVGSSLPGDTISLSFAS